MSELDPKEIFKSMEITEPFLYLERGWIKSYKRGAFLALFIAIVALSRIVIPGKHNVLNVFETGLNLDAFISVLLICAAVYICNLYWILAIDNFANSGLGITRTWLYFKQGSKNEFERKIKLVDIEHLREPQSKLVRFINLGFIEIKLKTGEKIKLQHVKYPDRFLQTISSLNQGINILKRDTLYG